MCVHFQLQTTNVCYGPPMCYGLSQCVLCMYRSFKSYSYAVYLYRNMNSWLKITIPCQCKTESKPPAALNTNYWYTFKVVHKDIILWENFVIHCFNVVGSCLKSKSVLSTRGRITSSQQLGTQVFTSLTSTHVLTSNSNPKLYAIVTTEQANALTLAKNTQSKQGQLVSPS